MGFYFFIILYMQNAESLPECAYQFFTSDVLNREELFEMISLASLYSEHLGPVIMICTEVGYDFLINFGLDELYIDILICQNPEMVLMVVDNLKDNINIPNSYFINSKENCHEKLRILYNELPLPVTVLQKIRNTIEAEETKNKI
jgi:hypothetical protein